MSQWPHESLGCSHDPATEAARRLEEAETALLNLPAGKARAQSGSAFFQAELAFARAGEAFADAVPSSIEGVLAKLQGVLDLCRAFPMDDDSLEVRHLQALVTCFQESRSAPKKSRRSGDRAGARDASV